MHSRALCRDTLTNFCATQHLSYECVCACGSPLCWDLLQIESCTPVTFCAVSAWSTSLFDVLISSEIAEALLIPTLSPAVMFSRSSLHQTAQGTSSAPSLLLTLAFHCKPGPKQQVITALHPKCYDADLTFTPPWTGLSPLSSCSLKSWVFWTNWEQMYRHHTLSFLFSSTCFLKTWHFF